MLHEMNRVDTGDVTRSPSTTTQYTQLCPITLWWFYFIIFVAHWLFAIQSYMDDANVANFPKRERETSSISKMLYHIHIEYLKISFWRCSSRYVHMIRVNGARIDGDCVEMVYSDAVNCAHCLSAKHHITLKWINLWHSHNIPTKNAPSHQKWHNNFGETTNSFVSRRGIHWMCKARRCCCMCSMLFMLLLILLTVQFDYFHCVFLFPSPSCFEWRCEHALARM